MPGLVADALRRPAVGGAEDVRAAHEVFDLRAIGVVGLRALEVKVVERQKHPLVELGAREFLRRGPGVGRALHAQLLRPLRLAKTLDVAARVQIDFSPDADRVDRDLYSVEALPRRSEERRVGK